MCVTGTEDLRKCGCLQRMAQKWVKKNSDFRTLMHKRKKHLNKCPFPP